MNLTPEQLAKTTVDHPIHSVLERMQKIQDKMTTADPEIGTHLKAIHKTLQEYEDLAHLLTPEQIGVLMKGLQKYTAISLVMEEAKKSKKSKKVSVDDLM